MVVFISISLNIIKTGGFRVMKKNNFDLDIKVKAANFCESVGNVYTMKTSVCQICLRKQPKEVTNTSC